MLGSRCCGPGNGSPFGVYTAAYVPQAAVPHVAVLPDGKILAAGSASGSGGLRALSDVGG